MNASAHHQAFARHLLLLRRHSCLDIDKRANTSKGFVEHH